MTINSLDVVFYTCIFLLPGFIIKSIIDVLVPPQKYNDTKYFFACLLDSVINCAIWSWAYYLLSFLLKQCCILYWLSLVGVTIVGSVIIALIIGIIKQKEIIGKVFDKIEVDKSNPIPTAWDYYFSKREESWIIVTLKNGKTIYGNYSSNSFASSDPEERDLYIEKTYGIDNEGKWIEDNQNKGILILRDDIETIEFLGKGVI